MKKAARAAFAILGIVFAGVLAGLGWLLFFFDAEDYREQLVEAVHRSSGRELTLEGALGVELIPRLALRTGAFELSSRTGFGEGPMIEAAAASIEVQIAPLLRGEVLVDQIRLERPVIRLGVAADGSTAWGDIADRARRVSGRGDRVTDGQVLGAGAAALAVQGLAIDGGEVHWSDERDGTRLDVTGIEVRIDRLSHRQPGRFTVAGAIAGDSDGGQRSFRLSGGIVVDFESLDLEFADTRLDLNGDGYRAALSLDRLRLSSLTTLPEVVASEATLDVTRGGLDLALIAPRVDYRHAEEALDILQWTLRGDAVSAGGSLVVRKAVSRPVARLEIAVSDLDLADLLDQAGFATGVLNRENVSNAALAATLELSDSHVDVERVQIEIGGSDISGNARLEDFDNPGIEVELRSRRLDMDSLFEKPRSHAGAAAPVALPLAILASVEGEFRMAVDSLVSGGLELRGMRIAARADSSRVHLDDFEAHVAGGIVSARGAVGKQAPFASELRGSVRDVDVAELAAGIASSTRLEGVGNVDMDLSSNGLTAEAISAGLSGTVGMTLRDGVVHGIDVERIIDAARQARGGQPTPEEGPAGPLQTRFSSFRASFVFERGIGETRDLSLIARSFQVAGGGIIDLPRSFLDHRVQIRLVKTPGAVPGDSETRFEPVPIPLAIRGPWSAPSVSVDVETLLRAEAGRRLERELLERSPESENPRDALGNLLKRKLDDKLE